MTYTLIVYFMLGFGPSEGLYSKTETQISDFVTCKRLESAVNQPGSPHFAECRMTSP